MTDCTDTILVTGAGGFLGKAITKLLLQKGYKVRSYARGKYPELEDMGVEVRRGDLTNESAVIRAAKGCSAIFHVAAKAGVWGSHASYYQPNVLGTRNILMAQKAWGIKRLVYTSTPSITFDGSDQNGIDETAPHAARFFNHYQSTKATAERIVLNANSKGFRTVALRPHLIWGPGDTQLVPRILQLHRRGRLKLVDGGLKKVDAVYIDNAAAAHMIAFEKLADENSGIHGKAYFITNNEPWPMAEIINGILKARGLDPVKKSISSGTAYAVGTVLEKIYDLFRIQREPAMTRFVAKQLATAHWYSTKRSDLELGYQPQITMSEGMKRLAESFH